MNSYEVSLKEIHHCVVIVNAQDEDEAKEMAHQAFSEGVTDERGVDIEIDEVNELE